MLKSWYLQNFKAIVDSGELKLAPLTVLAGRNSSGKSSLIQSILMIAQTLSNPLPDRALLPNGPIVQLGTFEDILSEQTGLRAMTVGFTLEVEREEQKQQQEQEDFIDTEDFKRLDINFVKITTQFRSPSSKGTSVSAIEASKVNVESVSLDIQGSELTPVPIEYQPPTLAKFSFDSNIAIKRLSPAELDEFLKDVLPAYLRFVPYANKEMNYRGDFTGTNTPDYVPETSLIALFHFLPMRLIHKWDGTLGEVYAYYVEEARSETTRFFASKIRYLSHSRVDPRVAQQFAPSSELDEVGAKGEHAAAAYHANQNAIIRWYNPSTEATEESTLNIAMNTWIRYLGVAHEVKTQETGFGGVVWQVVHIEGHKTLPLSAVGAGINQLLPILVMGLLTPDNTLLMIEESEVGLHPSIQARLGDFFMGLVKCNKQCLIETHSENLVSQLRIHIVKVGGQENAGCLIYFVDQDKQGVARFTPIKISLEGNILNWPDGFFDETMSQEDSITAEFLKKELEK